MSTKKHHPNDKLQKSSKLFLQLGLVLALVISYSILEISSLKKSLTSFHSPTTNEDIYVIPEIPDNFIIEKKVKPKTNFKTPKIPKQLDEFKIKEDTHSATTEIFKPEEPTSDDIDRVIDGLPNEKMVEPEPEPLPFIHLEQAPIFPGCEGLDDKTSKACFTKEISKFVSSKFNTSLAEELGLKGKQRIFVQFVIDNKGNVTKIKASAPHKKLQKEAIKIIEKLPQMIPGKQRTKPVSVTYTLPIKFEIIN